MLNLGPAERGILAALDAGATSSPSNSIKQHAVVHAKAVVHHTYANEMGNDV